MNNEQYLKNLSCPNGPVDVVLDTDAFNEIDDQYAIAYMIRSTENLNVKGICAAPFLNEKSDSPYDGMIKSYDEIFKILKLAGRTDLNKCVHKGSDKYLIDEETPVFSDAANFMAEIAEQYTAEKPLYIVATGAITDVASALLINPEMKEKTVIVWLGGNSLHLNEYEEFNMMQDVAAARIIFGCGVPFVHLPCSGVVDRFITTEYELKHWLSGKNRLCDYLVERTITESESYGKGIPWTRAIWDVTAVAWLLNQNNRFMKSKLIPSPIPEYDNTYSVDPNRHLICYVNFINRDSLFDDLFKKLSE